MINATFLKALLLLIIVGALFAWSFVSFLKRKEVVILLQALGAGFLIITALTHIFEGLHLFTFMEWGQPTSVGHYLDFSSTIIGGILFSCAVLFRVFKAYRQRTTQNRNSSS